MLKPIYIIAVSLFIFTNCTSENKEKENEPCPELVQNIDTIVTIEKDIKMDSLSDNLKLGAFSVSLNVKDLAVSKAFYENLGFSSMGGDMSMNYLIMKNGNSIIGLFQGMFEGNILTFNPGWDESAQNVENFDDIRAIQQKLIEQSIKLDMQADPNSTGPASIMLTDPDGNVILIDQHR